MKTKKDYPPKWTSRFLELVCKSEFLEEIQGDLLEYYQVWKNQYGPARAKWYYVFHSIKFLRYYAIKSFFPQTLKFHFMFRHHLRIAWRGLFHRQGHGLINVLGLSLGFASSLLIYLWSYQEWQTDRFHQNTEQLFGVYTHFSYPDGAETRRNTPAKLPAELQEIFPEIEHATGFAKSFRLSLQGVTAETFQKDDIILKMKGSRGSPQFFKIFSFEILKGEADNALLDPNSIAISRKMADIFFGSPEKAIGQSLRYQNTKTLSVSLIFEDIGPESSLKFDYLTNWDAWVDGDEFKPSWGHFGTQTYIKLQAGANPALLEEKLQNFLSGYLEFDEGVKGDLRLQPFGEQYLYDNFENGRPAAGRILYVRIFMGIAIFILLIAVINFVNLTTAKVNERAREVGLRKVIGAGRGHLRQQFLVESMVITIVSFLIGLLFAWALLPAREIVSVSELNFPINDLKFTLTLLTLPLSVAFISAIYPAWILSRMKQVGPMNRHSHSQSGVGRMRKVLVVVQFFISIFLIVATITLTNQMDFLLSKGLGFQRDNLVYIPIEGTLSTNYISFKEEAEKVSGVLNVDRSSQTPHNMGFSGPFLFWEGKEENDNTSFTPSSVGFDFLKTMQVQLVAGRDFDRGRPVDENNFLVNETAAIAMGGDVLGKTAAIFGKQGKIVGVIKDFHFNSLQTPIRPMVLDVKEGLNFGTIVIRLESQNLQSTLERLDELHQTLNPGYAFDYTFVDTAYESEYKMEQIVSSLVPYFAGLAIFISCLGLFGLVTFALQKRMKEVSIRKVLGATFNQLLLLLSRDYVVMLLVALILSIPTSYYLLSDWLEGYAYRIELSGWIFIMATVITLVISGLIVLAKVSKSVFSNPIDSLRSE